MEKILKSNVKFLNKKYSIAKILKINEQSLLNKIYDNKRKFSIEDVMTISACTNISVDDLLYKDLSKENEQI